MTGAAIAVVILAIVLFIIAGVIALLDLRNTGTLSEWNLIVIIALFIAGIVAIILQQRYIR